MLYYLPLELIDKRYTKSLDELLTNEFGKQGIEYITVEGKELSGTIDTGAFLDSDSTNFFKFEQLQTVAKLFKQGKIKNGDVFFLSDIWFPGIEAIKYMAMFHGITVKVGGLCHAGSWTETDFVRELEHWVRDIEIGWFKMYDFIFLGSTFAKKELIEKGVPKYFRRLHVTGFPFNFDELQKYKADKRENIVVFTGRLHDEKQPWEFDELRVLLPQYKFIKTQELNLDKESYYKLLGKSKVVFSSALQENFGYGVLEAVALGCMPVLPARLSYTDFFKPEHFYTDVGTAMGLIRYSVEKYKDVSSLVEYHKYNTKRIVDILKQQL